MAMMLIKITNETPSVAFASKLVEIRLITAEMQTVMTKIVMIQRQSVPDFFGAFPLFCAAKSFSPTYHKNEPKPA